MPIKKANDDSVSVSHQPHVVRQLLIGFFTIAPLWVTWIVFDFLFSLLAQTGAPFLRGMARALQPYSEVVAAALSNPVLHYVLAALLTLIGLYTIGLLTSIVLGRRILAWLESILDKVPLVHTIYRATKRLLESLQQPPVHGQRVVLIGFPSPEMKAVGFVTKSMIDPVTGQELVAVYVPTAPNPTSGYIEIVPLADVVQTDWTVEEAMSFVMTGGINAPDQIHFRNVPQHQR